VSARRARHAPDADAPAVFARSMRRNDLYKIG
jgi:hypothetical protein